MLGADKPVPRVAPVYTAASIVNAADNQSGQLAPNAIGTIYGVNLAYSTAAVTQSDLHGGVLPVVLVGASDTTVLINNSPTALYYVSPTQINFLVPPDILPGPVSLYVDVDTLRGAGDSTDAGPLPRPALFQLDSTNAVATRADGSVLTPSSPAKPGDVVELWATGLGPTVPPAIGFTLPTAAAPLIAGANLSILLDGTPVRSTRHPVCGRRAGLRRPVSDQFGAARVHRPRIRRSACNWTARPAFPACTFRWRSKC